MTSRNGSCSWLPTVVAVALGSLGFLACTKPKATANEAKLAAHQQAALAVGLSRAFQSPGKLITVHFPPDFTPEAPNESVLVLSRDVGEGNSEVLSFITVAEPAAKDFETFTSTAALSEIKRPLEWQYREVSRAKTTCNGAPGLSIVANWKPEGATSLHRRWWCAFLLGGHGYAFSYNVPAEVAAAHEPLLRSIIEATTFDKP